ncbi:hypothetical protein C8R44DRAFT_434410 [Mycena epipterygia]|nr:hypothetical protein C8R44DRAFT_434410 [Mycena epipterygia]
MYLVRPREELDEDGAPRLLWDERTFDFLSNYVASRTVELMEQNLDTVRDGLVSAFDDPLTHSAAGKLVESMLHRALRRGSLAPFGVGGRRLPELALIDKAADFILEGHAMFPPRLFTSGLNPRILPRTPCSGSFNPLSLIGTQPSSKR